jgi:hypothetical protein
VTISLGEVFLSTASDPEQLLKKIITTHYKSISGSALPDGMKCGAPLTVNSEFMTGPLTL